jgi:hypothetical protein
MPRLARRWRGFRGEERALKRFFYLCAFACLTVAGYYAIQLISMPNVFSEAIEAVDSHDPGASGDVDAARAQLPEAEGYLRDAGLFLLGFGACFAVARRVR